MYRLCEISTMSTDINHTEGGDCMYQFPETYENCIDLRTLTVNQRVELANKLKRAIAAYGDYDEFTNHRIRNLARVRAWLRHYDGIKV